MKTGSFSKKSSRDLNELIPLEPIPTARVSVFYGRSDEGRDGEIWRVNLVGSPRPAWVKLHDDARHTIADLVAAQVGRAIGMPIPKPYLAKVDLLRVPEGSAWRGQHGLRLFFASQHAGVRSRSFARILRGNDETMLRAIQSWAGFTATMIFDEWIANDDRNNGNMLYDPHNDGFWLIDHGRALTGDHWPLWGLDDPTLETGNMLVDGLRNSSMLTKLDTDGIAHESNMQMNCAAHVDWSMLDMNSHIQTLDPAISPDAIRRFLTERVVHTTRLLMGKLGLPELDLQHGYIARHLDADLH